MFGGTKMAFVIHMEKFKKNDLVGLYKHLDRKGECSTNPDINVENSGHNKTWKGFAPSGMYQKVKERIKSLNLKKLRKDAVQVCGFIITASADDFRDLSDKEIDDFFVDTIKWFVDKYGRDNISYAVIHRDETTPHLHIGVIPVIENKLAAKNLFNREALRDLQEKLPLEVGERYGIKRGEAGNKRKHIETARWKAERAKEALKQAEEAHTLLSGQIDLLKTQKKELEKDVRSLEKTNIDVDNKVGNALAKIGSIFKERHDKSLQLSVTKNWAKDLGYELKPVQQSMESEISKNNVLQR